MAEKTSSDDEFLDAVGEPATVSKPASSRVPDEKEIDEIIKKNSTLSLEDNEGNAGATGGTVDDDNAKDADDNEKLDPDGELTLEELQAIEQKLSPEELEANKEKANKLKLEGNELFKNEEALKAIEIYTEALNICPSTNSKERAVLFGNRAAAKMKLESKKSAIDDCSKAIELYPGYLRAILRRAKLYEQDDKLDEAMSDYKRVYEIDPGQQDAREAQIRLPPLINERNEKLKNEMMSSLKDLGNMILKPFGLSTSNFQMQQDPNSGSYSINFN
ncbi:CG14894, partial [Drosophila busckii]